MVFYSGKNEYITPEDSLIQPFLQGVFFVLSINKCVESAICQRLTFHDLGRKMYSYTPRA